MAATAKDVSEVATAALAVLDELRPGMAADGAVLTLVAADWSTVRVALVLTAAACLDCILPAETIAQTLLFHINAAVPGVTAVIVDDPREAARASGAPG